MSMITSNRYVKVVWVPLAYMSRVQAAAPDVLILGGPTTLDLTPATAWQDFSLAMAASDDKDDRGLLDAGNAKTRGPAKYEGALTFFREADKSDVTSVYLQVFEAFRSARQEGYLFIRVAEKAGDEPWAAGDYFEAYEFVADAPIDDAKGDVSVKFSIKFAPKGYATGYGVVSNGSIGSEPPDVVVPALVVASGRRVLGVTYKGKDIRAMCTYSSADPAVVSVDANGVLTPVSVGTAEVNVFTKLLGNAPYPVSVVVS